MAAIPEERDLVEPSTDEMTPTIQQVEESKLRAKYPNIVSRQPGDSHFLRKRLQKRQKYFDSGDYNMAKAKVKSEQLPQLSKEVTGNQIPTPQDLPQRKTNAMASKLAGPAPVSTAARRWCREEEDTGETQRRYRVDDNEKEEHMAAFCEERDFVEPSTEEMTPTIHQVEEAKLQAKYPNIVSRQPGGCHFLRERLHKRQKCFDSGDYNMAKAKVKNKQLLQLNWEVTGDHIPMLQDLP